jgi:hypothetical protein
MRDLRECTYIGGGMTFDREEGAGVYVVCRMSDYLIGRWGKMGSLGRVRERYL